MFMCSSLRGLGSYEKYHVSLFTISVSTTSMDTVLIHNNTDTLIHAINLLLIFSVSSVYDYDHCCVDDLIITTSDSLL